LILTKPVAKDQARTTIRTAVSRVRKDVPAPENVPAPPASVVVPEVRAQAAAVSSQLTNFAEPAPSFVPRAVPAAVPAALSAPAVKARMSSAVDQIEAAPAVPVNAKPTRPAIPSDDPVLAELEESELREAELKEAKLKEPELKEPEPKASDLKGSDLRKAAPGRRPAESAAPVFSSYQEGPKKTRGSLVALLILVLAAGGLYAAWMYQPGFREIAQPQIDRVLALAGMTQAHPQPSPKPAPVTTPVKPSAPLVPATTSAPEASTEPNPTPSTVADSTTSSAAATAPVPAAAVPVTAVAPPTSKAASPAVPVVTKPAAATASSSNIVLNGESSAVILSSKGAEKRLAHSFPPKYPVGAGVGGADGTVVLKAVVDENGKVDSLQLVEGDATLATAAIQAVKQWRYRPYLRNGKAQPFQTIVIVDFQHP
jgi:protein TonB